MIKVGCSKCGGRVTEDEGWPTVEEALSVLVERGITVEGDPVDPVILCRSCASRRAVRNAS